MLTIVMAFMLIMNSLLIYRILGFSLIVALLAGAIMTPTDPILSASILSGRLAENNLPEKLRNLISIESASNDGLGYPFVLLPILLMKYGPQKALSYWLIHAILWEVLGAVILGAIIGYLAGHLLKIALSKKIIDESSYVTYTLALALIVLSSVKLLGADGILAVFAAGVYIARAGCTMGRVDKTRMGRLNPGSFNTTFASNTHTPSY